jgi:hypothetical protein
MESTAPTSAATKVFNIPELFENIIVLVPGRDILARVQRVSRTWKNTVDNSPRVLEHLGRHKGKVSPAENPARFANPLNEWTAPTEWTDDQTDDFGVPIYKAPIEINNFFKRASLLYQNCHMSNHIDPVRNWFCLPESNWSKHTITIESFKSKDYPNGGPAFSNNPDLSWRSIQVCDPPITVARLRTYGGAQHWPTDDNDYFLTPFAASVAGPTGVLTTIFAKDGITLGRVHDTAAATLHSQTGEEDPRLGWHLHLCWGTKHSSEEHGMLEGGVDDSDDEGGEDGEDNRSGEWDPDDDPSGFTGESTTKMTNTAIAAMTNSMIFQVKTRTAE